MSSGNRRRRSRDQKYVTYEEFEQPGPVARPFLKPALNAARRRYVTGVDPAHGVDTTVTGYYEDGVFHVTGPSASERSATDRTKEMMRNLSISEMKDLVDDLFVTTIEGKSQRVETREDRLLDAGGSES